MSATMKLSYGSYVHDQPKVLIGKALERDERGLPSQWKYTITVSGWLKGESVSELKGLIKDLEDAHELSSSTSTLRYYSDTGSSETTAFEFEAEDTMGGIMVGDINYPEGIGAEWAVKRQYEIVYTFITKYQGASEVVSYVESLSFSGGGARTAWSAPIEGKPVKYQIAENTIFRAVETGTIIGRTKWQDAPEARWPDALNKADDEEITKGEPKEYRNGTPYMFPTTWTRTYMSAAAFKGEPRTSPPSTEA